MTPPFTPRPAEGLNYANAAAMFRSRAERTPELTALRYKQGKVWRSASWRDWETDALALAAGLLATGEVERGSRVAIMAANSREWILVDLAIAWIGAVSVPIYPTVSAEDAAFILADSGCTAGFFGTEVPLGAIRTHLAEHHDGAGPRRWILVGESGGARPAAAGESPATPLAELWDAGRARLLLEGERARLLALPDALGLEDPFSIVYTSGTTGTPKGVTLSQRNIVYEAWAIKNTIAADRTDEHLLVLPLAHIFARHLVWAAVESGAVTALGGGMERFEADMREIAPTYLGGVPHMYEKIRQRIEKEADASPAQRRIFEWGMELGHRASLREQRGHALPRFLEAKLAVARRLVFKRIHDALGGRLRFFISGAAPLPRELAEFFHATGILILEGYGLTETTGATHVNRPDRHRFGSVGPALPGCEVLIAPDGEILLRGNNVMSGYHGLARETAETIDEGGWLHTGDLGEITDGFLRITGRKKDLIITASGKNVAPQRIESRLAGQDCIHHAIVVGDGRPFLVALITLDEAVAMDLSHREGLGCKGYADLARHPRVREWVRAAVDRVNGTLAPFESIRDFALPEQPFTATGGDLTPTDKVRRDKVLMKFRHLVDDLYSKA